MTPTDSGFYRLHPKDGGGNVFSLSTPGGGGYPYPIMLCNITQNSMGQTPRGVPCQVQPGGVPCLGDTLPGGTQVGYLPARSDRGYPARGYPDRVPPSQVRTGGVPCWGGTQLGQQKEYSLYGGQYASCIHAGGLSCYCPHPKDGEGNSFTLLVCPQRGQVQPGGVRSKVNPAGGGCQVKGQSSRGGVKVARIPSCIVYIA